jgi:hypothetical protein
LFEEWRSWRQVFKDAIAKRLAAGEYSDIAQGLASLDLSHDPWDGLRLEDVTYFRKNIRPRPVQS